MTQTTFTNHIYGECTPREDAATSESVPEVIPDIASLWDMPFIPRSSLANDSDRVIIRILTGNAPDEYYAYAFNNQRFAVPEDQILYLLDHHVEEGGSLALSNDTYAKCIVSSIHEYCISIREDLNNLCDTQGNAYWTTRVTFIPINLAKEANLTIISPKGELL